MSEARATCPSCGVSSVGAAVHAAGCGHLVNVTRAELAALRKDVATVARDTALLFDFHRHAAHRDELRTDLKIIADRLRRIAANDT